MVEFLSKLLETSDFTRRWDSGVWSPGHGWLHIGSDLAIWAAYITIPCVLLYLTRPPFAVLVAFENVVLAANPRPLCVEYGFGPSSP